MSLFDDVLAIWGGTNVYKFIMFVIFSMAFVQNVSIVIEKMIWMNINELKHRCFYHL